MFAYKNHFYIFGGEFRYNSYHKMRECLNNLYSFDVQTKEWKQITVENESLVK